MEITKDIASGGYMFPCLKLIIPGMRASIARNGFPGIE